MTDLLNLVKTAKVAEAVATSVVIQKVDTDKRMVYGEVYAPDVIDAHGHAMTKQAVEKLAHDFMLLRLNDRIDVMHNNKPANASAVESFVARKGDPDFTEGAWVMGVKIFDDALWEDVKKGKYSGYSMEIAAKLKETTVEVQIENHVFGITEKNNGHTHAFYVEIDDDGLVVKGYTSEDDGHKHEISAGTATDLFDEHSHRFFIP